MDDWYVQVKGCGGDGGRSNFAEKDIVSILSEESKCRLGINHSGAHGVGSLRDAVCQMH